MINHGGKREGAGRKVGSGKFGEKTKVMRVPLSQVNSIAYFLKKKIKNDNDSPDAILSDHIFKPCLNSSEKSPFYDTCVSAGSPIQVDHFEEKELDLNSYLLDNPNHTFYVRVTGDSMVNAGIHPGDLLIVDRTIRPENGKIIIAGLNNELTVKRIFKEKGRLYLLPENNNYASIEVTEEMNFWIWGVVTGVVHKF